MKILKYKYRYYIDTFVAKNGLIYYKLYRLKLYSIFNITIPFIYHQKDSLRLERGGIGEFCNVEWNGIEYSFNNFWDAEEQIKIDKEKIAAVEAEKKSRFPNKSLRKYYK